LIVFATSKHKNVYKTFGCLQTNSYVRMTRSSAVALQRNRATLYTV